MWVGILVGAVVFGILIAMANAKALGAARVAYETALEKLSAAPHDNDLRVAALSAGRNYATIARKQAGAKGVAVFDEIALQNDLTARLGSGVAASTPAPAAEDRVDKLSKLAELRDKGVLTAEEFESEKRKLLAS